MSPVSQSYLCIYIHNIYSFVYNIVNVAAFLYNCVFTFHSNYI